MASDRPRSPSPAAVVPPASQQSDRLLVRRSTTTALEYGETINLETVDLNAKLKRFREMSPEAAEQAMARALERADLADPARADEELARLETAYHDSSNPFYALEAFAIARHARRSTPEWILEYFERSAKRVMLRPRGDRKNRVRAIAEAFNLAPERKGRGAKAKGRRPDAMDQLDRDYQTAKMVEAFAELRSQGIPRLEALEAVAERLNSNPSTVRDALKLHRRR